MDINLNLLKYYYEVVKERSITKAAEKIFITQPAMSRAIKELETQLNTILLERNKKGVVPTEEGLILYNHIESILNEIDKTRNIIENSADISDLYIGTTTSNFFNLLIDLLKELNDNFIDLRVHLIFDNIYTLNDMRKSGKLDILIKGKNEDMDNFTCFDNLELRNYFIASRHHFPELADKHISIEELLNNYPIVIMSSVSPGRRVIDEYLKEKNIKYKPTYEFNSYDLCKKLVVKGLGIGVDNTSNYNEKDYIFIDTDPLPTRYFQIGYINTSKNKYIKKLIDIYKKNK